MRVQLCPFFLLHIALHIKQVRTETYKLLSRSPAYCPAGYSVFRGMCYKLVTASDHKEALVACNAESAALAYPEEPDVLFFLSALFRVSTELSSQPIWFLL